MVDEKRHTVSQKTMHLLDYGYNCNTNPDGGVRLAYFNDGHHSV